jgi:predicted nucleotidyltransferase
LQERSSDTVRVFFPKLNRDQLICKLRRAAELASRVLNIKKVVLFGSWAKGNYTAFSDVDILVNYAGKKIKNDLSIISKVLRIPNIELFVYAEEEYVKLRSLENLIVKEAKNTG